MRRNIEGLGATGQAAVGRAQRRGEAHKSTPYAVSTPYSRPLTCSYVNGHPSHPTGPMVCRSLTLLPSFYHCTLRLRFNRGSKVQGAAPHQVSQGKGLPAPLLLPPVALVAASRGRRRGSRGRRLERRVRRRSRGRQKGRGVRDSSSRVRNSSSRRAHRRHMWCT